MSFTVTVETRGNEACIRVHAEEVGSAPDSYLDPDPIDVYLDVEEVATLIGYLSVAATEVLRRGK